MSPLNQMSQMNPAPQQVPQMTPIVQMNQMSQYQTQAATQHQQQAQPEASTQHIQPQAPVPPPTVPHEVVSVLMLMVHPWHPTIHYIPVYKNIVFGLPVV
jgi:hypothetical protein